MQIDREVAAMGVDTDTEKVGCCLPLCAVGTALVDAGVPVHVAAALADVARAGRAGPGGQLDRPDLDRRSPDGALGVIESRDVVTNWLDSVAVDATRALVEQVGEECRPAPLEEMTGGQRDAWRSDTRMAVAAEVEAATGASIGVVHKLVGVALAPVAASGRMLSGLRSGGYSLFRVETVIEATADLPPEAVAEVADVALAPRRDGRRRSSQQFRRVLRREVAKRASSDEAAAREARARARRSRRVDAEPWQDGVGELSVSGAWERIVAANARVDVIARRFRSAGDERTLDQLRSDVLLDLVLYGDICGHERGSALQGRGVQVSREGASAGRAGASHGPGDEVLGEYRELGALPPAHVDVVVTLPTLLGLDNGIGEVPGYGFLTAEHVRQVALAAGSVWRRLVVDPLTGRAVERSIERYRPDAAMREQVQALDGVCRGPGCTIPATQCDLDHVVEYGKGGLTSEINLQDLHRRHHNLSTKALWTCERHGDGVVEWRTLIGRRYETEPFDYLQLLGDGPRSGAPRPPWQERPFDPDSYRVPDEERARRILGPHAADPDHDSEACGERPDHASDACRQAPDHASDARVSSRHYVPQAVELSDLARAQSRSLLEDGLRCIVEDFSAADRDPHRAAAPQPATVDWAAPRRTFVIPEAPPPF